MDDRNLTILAKMTYGAYGQVTDYKNYQGLPMPEWDRLTDQIREAWKVAALYAYTQGQGSAFMGDLTPSPDHR